MKRPFTQWKSLSRKMSHRPVLSVTVTSGICQPCGKCRQLLLLYNHSNDHLVCTQLDQSVKTSKYIIFMTHSPSSYEHSNIDLWRLMYLLEVTLAFTSKADILSAPIFEICQCWTYENIHLHCGVTYIIFPNIFIQVSNFEILKEYSWEGEEKLKEKICKNHQ